MKTIQKSIWLVLFSLAVISSTSCSKDDDGGSGGNAASGTIKAKVNGTNFTSNKDFTIANLVTSVGTLTIQGSDNSGKGIRFMVSGFEGEGSYNIGGGANVFVNASYFEGNATNPSQTQTWQAPFDDTVAGEIKFSEVTNTNVKGTFYFTAKKTSDGDTKEITEGSFNIKVTSM